MYIQYVIDNIINISLVTAVMYRISLLESLHNSHSCEMCRDSRIQPVKDTTEEFINRSILPNPNHLSAYP